MDSFLLTFYIIGLVNLCYRLTLIIYALLELAWFLKNNNVAFLILFESNCPKIAATLFLPVPKKAIL